MSIERTKSKQKVKEPKTKITWKEIKRQKVLLFWAAIMVVYGVVFYYLPLAGWTMAFQNYKPRLGIFHSKFVGLEKYVGNGCYQSGGNIYYSNCFCNFIK